MINTDIVIIGAGAVGTAIARELSKYKIDVIVVDKRDDVGGDASKSNSSIICTGYDCPPGSLETQICRSSRMLVDQAVKELDVPFRVCGAIMPAINKDQMEVLKDIYEDSYKNEIYDIEWESGKQLLDMEPELNPDTIGGLYIPREAVIDNFMFVVAMAENAAKNGVQFLLRNEVIDIETENGKVKSVITNKEIINTKYVINAAGLFCDSIAAMVAECDFTVKPRKGQFFILDKNTDCQIDHIIYPIPTPTSRGKLLLKTIHGNILCGPTSEDLEDKEDHSVTADELAGVERDCRQLVPNINFNDAVTQFAGLRPNRIPAGFHIGFGKTEGYFGISGVRSTGISCSLGIGRYVVKKLQEGGVKLERNFDFDPYRKAIPRFSQATDEERDALISMDPKYGRIICRCETVTEGEIVDALHRAVPPTTLDGVKRRLRAGMGRCQGGFCSPKVIEIIARELNLSPEEVDKNVPGSYILTGLSRKEGGENDA